MKKDHFIITGTSRGIGEALAHRLLNADCRVISISRNYNARLQMEASMRNREFTDICFDLNMVGRIPELVHDVFRKINRANVARLFLVNNAGIVQPIVPVGARKNPESLIRSMNVNLISPVLITEQFISRTNDWGVERRVLNMSTGGAERPIQGWSAYCSGKAGLQMFARCVAEEQANEATPVKIVSLSPGVVDTEMQEEIRESTKENFPDVQRYRSFAVEGKLKTPDRAAEMIIDLLLSDDFGSETMMRLPDN